MIALHPIGTLFGDLNAGKSQSRSVRKKEEDVASERLSAVCAHKRSKNQKIIPVLRLWTHRSSSERPNSRARSQCRLNPYVPVQCSGERHSTQSEPLFRPTDSCTPTLAPFVRLLSLYSHPMRCQSPIWRVDMGCPTKVKLTTALAETRQGRLLLPIAAIGARLDRLGESLLYRASQSHFCPIVLLEVFSNVVFKGEGKKAAYPARL